MWHHCFRNDRWQSYFQQPGLAVWASVQPISLRCLCTQVTFRFSFTAHLQLTTDLNCIYNTLLKRRTRDKHSSLFGWITSKKKFFEIATSSRLGKVMVSLVQIFSGFSSQVSFGTDVTNWKDIIVKRLRSKKRNLKNVSEKYDVISLGPQLGTVLTERKL
jgi:hypothetical protein